MERVTRGRGDAMSDTSRRSTTLVLSLAISVLIPRFALAQTPGEVQGLVLSDTTTLSWDPVTGSDFYNVYRADLMRMAAGAPSRCHGFSIPGTSFQTTVDPEIGKGFVYLATAESVTTGEGPAGDDSSGNPRPLLAACGPVMPS